MILENRVLQKMKLSRNNFDKKLSHKVSFLTGKKVRNFQMIFDLENSTLKVRF